MKYTLGLDLGTTSVGWAVLDPDGKEIKDLGVRIFTSAEHPKDGSSLAEPRRLARGTRRRLARRRMRLDHIRQIFIKRELLKKQEIDSTHAVRNNPYKLRAEGLDRVLTPQELFVAVYHLAKRRGYKSNRKKILEIVSGDVGASQETKEAKEVLGSIQENWNALKKSGFRTVGEMLFHTLQKGQEYSGFEGIRNKTGSYIHSVSREMLREELVAILTAQKRLGSTVGDTVMEELVATFDFQRHFASGERLKNLVGKCQFEKNERRAAKASYRFQYFRILETLNRLMIHDENTGLERRLTHEQTQSVIGEILQKADFNYAQLKKVLGLGQESRFTLVRYFVSRKKATETGVSREAQADEIEKKTKFPSMKDFYQIRKAIRETDESFWETIGNDLDVLDAIGEVLTLYKTDEDITEGLRKISKGGVSNIFPGAVEAALLGLSFSKFGHLSLKALKKIIPGLENGLSYAEAVTAADPEYGKFQSHPEKKLKPLRADDHSLTNPVVRRTVSQAIKVINAIVDRHGSPAEVHIELARELAKDFKERRDITKKQEENHQRNEETKNQIVELYGMSDPKGQDIVRYKLWREQNCKCAYSGKPISEERLFEDGYTEIDHIIPFSRSFNDSYGNKVLVLTAENREKLDRLPYEVFGADEDRWQKFENLVTSMNISESKKRNLLLKKYVADELTTRTLNDTRFIARYLKDYIKAGLLFDGGQAKVLTVNGAATAYLRKRWGLNKVREESDRHHAQDAAVVAATNASLVQLVAWYSKIGEVKNYLKTHKIIENIHATPEDVAEARRILESEQKGAREHFPQPWDGFSRELDAKVHSDALFVSRMPRRTISGQLHDDTLRSPQRLQEEISTVKKALTAISEKDLEAAHPSMDPLLYKALRERLGEHGGDAKKAFATPLYKKQKDGSQGPIVRAIKVPTIQKSGVALNDGKAIADRASMIRVDIFSKEVTSGARKGKKEWFFVPVYAHQARKGVLPDKAATPGKSESEWEKMDEAYTFEFTLYPGDCLSTEKDDRCEFWYYLKAGVSNACLTMESHDSNLIKGLGIKTLDKMQKYMVSVLGELHKVHHEVRLDFSRKKS